jgi:AAA15 family ATPase/GTPase
MFEKLCVSDFRMLKNKDFQIGRYITMLAGWNATGKSTILALLANGTELKLAEGKTYNGKQFKAEFSEILKGSNKFDIAGENKFKILFNDGNTQREKVFRTGWQDNDTRFRVIPKEVDSSGKKINEAKFEYPVIYLGLSRLDPLGETEDKHIKDSVQAFVDEDDNKWFQRCHKAILSLSDENITDITHIDFKSKKKNTAGINSDYYDWKTNSAGQDNISQILLAILSFKSLKKQNKLKAGLLIIDELESSLHPKAQQKIVELLIKESKDNGFQVIFTTHSLTIIKIISEKVRTPNDNVIYYYFTKTNKEVEILQNHKYEEIEQD